MAGEYTLKRIFEIAREFRISTPEIIEYLGDIGHDVTRKQMQPVTEPMYIALLHKFDRPKFDQYLIEHGIVGEELRRMARLLDEQKKKIAKPVAPPKPEPIIKTTAPRRRAVRNVRAPTEKSTTIKVTYFRRKLKEPAPKTHVAPVSPPPSSLSIFAQVSDTPGPIPSSPLFLELLQQVLALPIDRKQGLLNQLRAADPR